MSRRIEHLNVVAARDAIQVAAIAGEYEIAADIARRSNLNVCLRCGRAPSKQTKMVQLSAPNVARGPIGWAHTSCAKQIAGQLKRKIFDLPELLLESAMKFTCKHCKREGAQRDGIRVNGRPLPPLSWTAIDESVVCDLVDCGAKERAEIRARQL
jgi:hypothetical protein